MTIGDMCADADKQKGEDMEKSKPEIVFQVGMIVKDVDKVLENLKDYFEIDEDSIVVKSTKEKAKQGIITENKYNGKPAEFYIKTARLNFGGIDFEYIQPLCQDGGDPYSDWLLEHGQGIHHINMKLENRKVLDDRMAQEGVVAHIWSKTGDVELETYDFREKFGFISEVGDMVVGPMAKVYYSDKENK